MSISFYHDKTGCQYPNLSKKNNLAGGYIQEIPPGVKYWIYEISAGNAGMITRYCSAGSIHPRRSFLSYLRNDWDMSEASSVTTFS